MSVLVDTSALVALLDEAELHHERARDWFSTGPLADQDLFTHNYVVVEATAVVRNRMGAEQARRLLEDLVPVLRIVFVDPQLHRVSQAAYLASGPGAASLVDWVSFELMREHGVTEAFAFDSDFVTQGFTLVA